MSHKLWVTTDDDLWSITIAIIYCSHQQMLTLHLELGVLVVKPVWYFLKTFGTRKYDLCVWFVWIEIKWTPNDKWPIIYCPCNVDHIWLISSMLFCGSVNQTMVRDCEYIGFFRASPRYGWLENLLWPLQW